MENKQDPLRRAYGAIMYWADLRAGQQRGAQMVLDTSQRVRGAYCHEDDKHSASCGYMVKDLLMAAALVAQQGGFEDEHRKNVEDLYARWWGDNPDRFKPSPWTEYGFTT